MSAVIAYSVVAVTVAALIFYFYGLWRIFRGDWK